MPEWRAPCGHSGTPVIGAYVNCSLPSCDGLPGDRCHKCPSRDLYPFVAPFVPPDAVACRSCGAVRWNGV
jgi:hypothetical protein